MKHHNNGARAALSAALIVGALAPGMAAGQPAGGVWDWSRVEQLAAGREITVALRGTGALRCRVAFANSDTLVVSRFVIPDPSRRVLRALELAGPRWPAVFSGGMTSTSDSVLISRDGIFDAGVKVGEVIGLSRDEVLEIRGNEKRGSTGRRGSVLGAVAGASGGGVLGFFGAVSLMFKPCGGSCDDEKALMGLSLVGLPIAGGLLGYYAGGLGDRAVTLYRAPVRERIVLDDAMWQRVRQTLPASLRGGASR